MERGGSFEDGLAEARRMGITEGDGAYDVVHRNLYNVHQRVAASFRNPWTFMSFDVSAHKNAAMRVRFGYDIGSSGVFRSVFSDDAPWSPK